MRRPAATFWLMVVLAATAGLLLRVWNLDYDDRQHLQPDERHWSLVASRLDTAVAPDGYPTVAGPVLDWLDGQRSPTNPYRNGNDSFVYGPVTMSVTRAVAGWLYDGAATGAQPARLVAETVDRLGVPLLDPAGGPRFDRGYQIDLVGRLLGALTDTVAVVVVGLAGRRLGGQRSGHAVGIGAAWIYASLVLLVQYARFFGAEPALALASALCVLAMLHVDRSDSTRRALATGALVGASAGLIMAVKFSGLGLALVPFALLAALVVRHRRRVDVARLGAAIVGGAVAFRVLCPPAFRGLGVRPNPEFWGDLARSREAVGAGLPPSIQWADRVPVLEATWWLTKHFLGPGAVALGIVGLVVAVRQRHVLGRWSAAVVVAGTLVPWAFVFRSPVTTGRYFVPMFPAFSIAGGLGIAFAVAAASRLDRPRRRVADAAIAVAVVAVVVWPIAFVNGVHGDVHTRIAATRWIGANVEPGSVLTSQGWDDALPLPVDGVDPSRYESRQLDLFGPDAVDKVARLAVDLADVDYVVESSPRVWDAVVRIPARYPSTIEFFKGLDDGSLGFERVATFTSPPELGPLRLSGGEEAFSVYDHPEVRIWERVEAMSATETFRRLDPVAAAAALPIHPDDAGANGGMLTRAEIERNDRRGTFADDFVTSGVMSNTVVQAVAWFAVTALLAAAAWLLLVPLTRRLPDAGIGVAATFAVVGVVAGAVVLSGGLGLAYGRTMVGALAVVLVAAGGWSAWWRRPLVAQLWRERRRTMIAACVVPVGGYAAGLAVRAANPDLWHQYRGGEKPFELAMLTSVLRSRSVPPPDAWFAGGALNYHYGGSMLVAVPARIMGTVPEVAMNLGIAFVAMLGAGAAFTAGGAVAVAVRRQRTTPAVQMRVEQRVAQRAGLLSVGFVFLLPNAVIVGPVVRRLLGDERGQLDWWALSRTVPNSPIVTEFPGWTVLFGDLHGHLLALPIVLTLVATLVLLVDLASGDRIAPLLAASVAAGLLVGAIRSVNSYGFPVAAGLTVVTLVVAAVVGSWRRAIGAAAVAAIVAVTVWLPYTSRVDVGNVGVELNRLFTPTHSFLWHYAFWLLVTAVVLVVAVPAAVIRDALRRLPRSVLIAAVVAVGAAGAIGAVAGFPVLVLTTVTFVLCSLGTLLVVRGRRTARVGVAGLAVASLAWALVSAAELVMVIGDFDRMNTVFKWWFDAWLLLAVAAAAVFAGATRRWRGAVGTVVGLAALMGAAFLVLAVPARLADRESEAAASLDGLAFLDGGIEIGGDQPFDPGEDAPLIDWIRAHVDGMPTLLEAPGEGYRWTGRIAATTGIPTVIGWPYHESQQRANHGLAVDDRHADATAFYVASDDDVRLDVLWRRDVDLVVFGTAERVLAGPEGAAAVRSLPCLDVVFEHASTFVAEVDRACLEPRATDWSLRNGGVRPDIVIE
jgi:YYY domain-containing protein